MGLEGVLPSVDSRFRGNDERGAEWLWALSGVVGVVVFVLLSGMLGGVGWDSDAVFEYEVGELPAVDQADVLVAD